MAFVKKTWKNRVSEFFNRYRMENAQTGAISRVYMNLDDGAVTQEGDVIDADTMNDLEDRISTEFQSLTNNVSVLAENGVVNLAPNNLVSQTTNGITFVVNDDKSISASGTCTGNIRLNIGTITLKKDITYRISDSQDGKTAGNANCQIIARTTGGAWVMVSSNAPNPGNTYTPDADTVVYVTVAITNGATINATLYPMIVNADYSGDYVPYAKTNRELTVETDGLWDNMMDNGAVNIFNNTLASQTYNGVVFTVNADKTITTTGTPSTGFSITIGKIKPPIGMYKLTCSPSSSTGSTYKTQILKNGGGSGNTWEETGDGFVLNQTNASDEWTINIRFAPEYAGTQLPSGLVWKPMLSDASLNLSYDDYVPYAKSNRELTEVIKGELTGDVIFFSNSVVKQNNIVTINAAFQADKDYAGYTQIVNIPSDFRPLNINPIAALLCDNNNSIIIPLTAFPNGKIQGGGALVSGYYYRFSMTYILV